MRKTRILIVEDDATLSEQITQLLQSRGFDTRHESDGNAGLQAVLEENFDLVLLDIRLPSLNGLSLLNQLRQIKQTPVMMITAQGNCCSRTHLRMSRPSPSGSFKSSSTKSGGRLLISSRASAELVASRVETDSVAG